jgi:hypothetical protein
MTKEHREDWIKNDLSTIEYKFNDCVWKIKRESHRRHKANGRQFTWQFMQVAIPQFFPPLPVPAYV